ncbi:hypothetical protein SOASR030_37520 [Leminorella grimontii]|uniref:Uncharacterized protein n=1 Tax=Leminorella grimontii TaxID=82981 RepID=A0AAV5N6M4_9GAMM|nr:hypothetical protein [Leminorella grimontii]KFC92473.1 hypothetical protein GLGR_3803 [Leminorella grimontii ATCC 33999 = DSM 5078]GKX57640.1 hypothetical protein SOASR030_37520 [Leminorella grimontii]
MKEKQLMTITIRVVATPEGLDHALRIEGALITKDAIPLYKNALEATIPDVGLAAEKVIAKAIKNREYH